MSPEMRVLRQTIEALACEGLLAPGPGGWQIGGLAIRAPYRRGGFGRVRLLGDPVTVDGQPLRLPDLLAALAAAGHDTARLGEALDRTTHFLRAAGLPPRDRLALHGAALDASLIEGHPYHPCFKSRLGFSDVDNRAFGPEAGQPFRPLWLAVDPSLVCATGTALAEGQDLAAVPGRVLMPVHPWQWRQLATEPCIAGWLQAGRMALLGEGGPMMRATQSLRTLAPADPARGGDHLKLSLGVGVTSSVRDIAPWSVAVAPAISDWLGRVVAEDPAFARWPLTILPEHGAAIVGRPALGGRLAALRRKAPPEGAVPLNALSLCEPDGPPLIAPWLKRHGVERWVARLLEVVVLPVWHLMAAHGIGLEAHGQNLLLQHDEGWPRALVARDFHESLEYVPGCLSRPDLLPDLAAIDPGFATAADDEYHRMSEAGALRDLVLDCLGVHLLSELAHLLHRQGWMPESRFWALLRACLAAYAEAQGAPPRALGLAAPSLPAESLAARALGLAQTSHPVLNPLAETDPMPEFQIDSRRIRPDTLDLPDLLVGADPAHSRIALHIADKAICLAQILRLREAGASVYPIHPEMPRAQALELARRAGCSHLATEGGIVERLGEAPACPGGVLIQMSSGTTGAPKVIARSWAEIETEIAAYRQALPEGDFLTPVIAAPITHAYGLIAGTLVGLARGKVPVILDSANPKTILRQLALIDAPLLYAAPALLHVLARLAGRDELPAVVMTSGTVLPQPWFDTIRGAARALFQQYGCSEAGCLALTTAPTCPEDMGLPLPHVRLTAGDSDPAPVRLTREGGDLETGDLGRLDARGHLIFAGRAAEVIDVAGINVYPAEIERVALAIPGVTDAVAFALPDDAAHQRPGLAVAGTAPREVIEAHLAAHLAPRQRPARVFAVESVPRGPGGKVSRRLLAETYGPAPAGGPA